MEHDDMISTLSVLHKFSSGEDKEALGMALDILDSLKNEYSCIYFMKKMGATCIAKRNEAGELVAILSIDHLPITEKTAEWIIRKDGDSLFVECSECHRTFGDSPRGFIYWVINNLNYCPKCGRRMKGAEKDEQVVVQAGGKKS